jgi:hypothetical protein
MSLERVMALMHPTAKVGKARRKTAYRSQSQQKDQDFPFHGIS